MQRLRYPQVALRKEPIGGGSRLLPGTRTSSSCLLGPRWIWNRFRHPVPQHLWRWVAQHTPRRSQACEPWRCSGTRSADRAFDVERLHRIRQLRLPPDLMNGRQTTHASPIDDRISWSPLWVNGFAPRTQRVINERMAALHWQHRPVFPGQFAIRRSRPLVAERRANLLCMPCDETAQVLRAMHRLGRAALPVDLSLDSHAPRRAAVIVGDTTMRSRESRRARSDE